MAYKRGRYCELYHQVHVWSHTIYFEGDYYSYEDFNRMFNEAIAYMAEREAEELAKKKWTEVDHRYNEIVDLVRMQNGVCCKPPMHCLKCHELWCQEMTKVNWKKGAQNSFCHYGL